MHIIFGEPDTSIKERYVVLELDTFRLPDNELKTSYCVIETLPMLELDRLDAFKKLHSELVHYYKKREWDYCLQVIEGLRGQWSGEVDSFYDNLAGRIEDYKDNPPGADWDGVIDRS